MSIAGTLTIRRGHTYPK